MISDETIDIPTGTIDEIRLIVETVNYRRKSKGVSLMTSEQTTTMQCVKIVAELIARYGIDGFDSGIRGSNHPWEFLRTDGTNT